VTGEEAARVVAQANRIVQANAGGVTGSRRAAEIGQDISKSAFESIQKINTNMANLDRATLALQSGADVGFVQSQLPAANPATLELRQIVNVLGLDVLNSATFGALSEKELELALDTALPTKMERADLIKWVADKKAAQQKLVKYFTEQARFLSIPGRGVGDWLDHLEEIKKQNSPQGGSAKPAIASVKVIP